MDLFFSAELIFPVIHFYDKFSELLGQKECKCCECVCGLRILLCCFLEVCSGPGVTVVPGQG